MVIRLSISISLLVIFVTVLQMKLLPNRLRCHYWFPLSLAKLGFLSGLFLLLFLSMVGWGLSRHDWPAPKPSLPTPYEVQYTGSTAQELIQEERILEYYRRQHGPLPSDLYDISGGTQRSGSGVVGDLGFWEGFLYILVAMPGSTLVPIFLAEAIKKWWPRALEKDPDFC